MFPALRTALPVALFALSAPLLAQPRAVVVEPTKDFAIVAKGEILVQDFTIRNDGDAPLELLEVKPSCGCTVADYTALIAPGETGQVHAEVATVTFDGPIAKSIAVFTNDPAQPKLQLVVKAEVKPYIAVKPGYARFIYVQGEGAGVIAQNLYSQDGNDIEILSVDYPQDLLELSYRESLPDEKIHHDGKQWKVDVKIRPDAAVGPIRALVTLKLDHPKQKEVKIPISGFVRPRQHLTPYELDVGKLDSAHFPYERRLDFTSFITEEIAVQKVESGVAGLSAEVTPSDKSPGHRFKVTVRFSPDMPKGPFDTMLKIHIDDPKNPVVQVPIRGTVI